MADVRFACAQYLADATNKLMGRDIEQFVVRWGVDYDFFQPSTDQQQQELRSKLNLPQDKVIILTTGTAIVRKGWLDLFDALAVVAKRNANFLLVGIHAGKSALDLSSEAAARGLSGNFLNLGEVPPSAINDYYRAADIFCLPSHWEGLANAVIEAMSTGLPVLTTDVCGHPEIVFDGENGLLIPPKQPQLIADRLSKLIADKAYRLKLGENARKHIVEVWGNYEDNTSLLYDRLKHTLNS
jgi:glycosyltransferase involved in cell wall biosynthesis